MLGVGDKFPSFQCKAVISNEISNAFLEVDNNTYKNKWIVLFFYPKDFTFVCPTEILGFDKLSAEFEKRNAKVLCASTDSEFVHLAWRKELGNIAIPMLSDITRELSGELGILDKKEGIAKRATYIIDPDGIIRFLMVTDLSIGRNPNEALRILDALKTGELCPCNWEKGQATLSA